MNGGHAFQLAIALLFTILALNIRDTTERFVMAVFAAINLWLGLWTIR